MILSEDREDAEIDLVKPLMRDAMITALSDMVQIDWGALRNLTPASPARLLKTCLNQLSERGAWTLSTFSG